MLDLPRPTGWDLAALAGAALALAVAGANTMMALGGAAGAAPSNTFTLTMALTQGAICTACLFLLGKTAKHGTIWGNLAAVAGMLVGMTGILLAGALWVAA